MFLKESILSNFTSVATEYSALGTHFFPSDAAHLPPAFLQVSIHPREAPRLLPGILFLTVTQQELTGPSSEHQGCKVLRKAAITLLFIVTA